MTSLKLKYKRTDPQRTFMGSDEKFRLFVSGVGGGKTACGWFCAIEHVFKNPGSLGVIIAPTYQLLRDVIIRERVSWLPDKLIHSYNKTEKEMILINGSTILFRSAADEARIERLRGLTISWFWIDEATLLPPLVLEIMTARMRQPGFPHKAWLTCTPKKNWVYDLVQKRPKEWFILDEINSDTNTFLPKGYIETLKQSYSGPFYEQEVLGKWIDFEGLVYNFQIREAPNIKPSRVFYGLDWGWEDQTAITVIYEINGLMYAVDETYKSHMTNDDIISELKAKYAVHGHGPVYCDPSAAGTIAALVKGGINAKRANNKRADGIRILNNMVQSKLFVSERCVNILEEGRQYVYDGTDSKTKGTCHAMDSLRYGVTGILRGTTYVKSGVVRGK